jgi:Tol biopolymer transport system component
VTLIAGNRLGPYEVLSALGAGGMGEVYKARDTRLERTVAIKVLPQHLSSSPDVRQRFEREAKTISQLSHPHICAIHDVGREGETEYLVMEYLEGETLFERLVKGPLPLEQTLRYGMEIADALDKAHRQGIVHRDLKPGNIMLTKSGVKLLDFGLAKVMAPAPEPSGLTALPTIAGTSPLTQEGTILGTFQYMAPEQLEGREADARTDIFAFGAVLYEMATGKKAFAGASQASLISSIMTSDPAPVSSLVPMTPPAFDRVVRTCLAKDPEDRWQSARDIAGELRWISQGGSGAGIPAPAVAPPRRRERVWQAVAAAAVIAAGILAAILIARARRPARPLHLAVAPPPGTAFWLEPNGPGPAVLSPDGTRVAFTAADEKGKVNLYVKSIESGEARALSGAEGAQYPFWSPDSRSLGFFAAGKLKTIEAAGGPPFTVCNAAEGKGGAWNAEGTILFAPNATAGLFRVSTKGGEPAPLTRLDAKRGDESHRHPRFLPDGRHFLYLVRSTTTAPEGHSIVAASLDGGPEKVLLRSPAIVEYAAGRLLFLRESTLMSRSFDPSSLAFTGEAEPVAERIFMPNTATALGVFSASKTGLLAYQTARGQAGERLQWFTREGKPLDVVGEPGEYRDLALSPDGSRAAVCLPDQAAGTHDIWIFDLAHGLRSRFTFDPGDDRSPVWSPDGSAIVFASSRKGHYDIYRKAPGGSAEEEPLYVSQSDKSPAVWSPDGRYLLYYETTTVTDLDVWILPMDGSRKPEPFLKTKAGEAPGAFSPDGRWVAYGSDESGQFETYATRFPKGGRKWQISSGGGVYCFWSRDGKEILYQANDGMLHAVPVIAREESLEPGSPQTLFRAAGPFVGAPAFSPTADHQKILAVAGGQEPNPYIDLVVNWTNRTR